MDKKLLGVFIGFVIISGLIWVFTLMIKVETEEIVSPPAAPIEQTPVSFPERSVSSGEEVTEEGRITGPLLN